MHSVAGYKKPNLNEGTDDELQRLWNDTSEKGRREHWKGADVELA